MFSASMQFDLGEDVNALREMVHRWAQERVRPLAAEIDTSNAFPNALWREMGDLGLLGVTLVVWRKLAIDEGTAWGMAFATIAMRRAILFGFGTAVIFSVGGKFSAGSRLPS